MISSRFFSQGLSGISPPHKKIFFPAGGLCTRCPVWHGCTEKGSEKMHPPFFTLERSCFGCITTFETMAERDGAVYIPVSFQGAVNLKDSRALPIDGKIGRVGVPGRD